MVLGLQDLKVDQTALSVRESTLFVTNVNIPYAYLDNVVPVLQRVYTFINNEYFLIDNIKYKVTATYLLKNTDTNELRQWAGSFMPGQNNLSNIDDFTLLTPNFVNRVEPLCDKNSIGVKLALHNVETKWAFEQLTSVVICFQAQVHEQFDGLARRNLRIVRRHGRGRNHTTFPLP